MITKAEPLSLVEAGKLVSTGEESKEIKSYIKKFGKIKPEKATEIRKNIEGLDNIKIKKTHIAKIIDILPEDAEDVNKIFTDISLNEEELNKVLEIVKKYK